MSFIGKAIKSIGRALGLVPSKKASTPPAAPPPAPVMADVKDDTTQRQLAMVAGGRTSTVLTGGEGEDETKLKTSKVLLGQ